MSRKKHTLMDFDILITRLFLPCCLFGIVTSSEPSIFSPGLSLVGTRSLNEWFHEAINHLQNLESFERQSSLNQLNTLQPGTAEYLSWLSQRPLFPAQNASKFAFLLEDVSRRTVQQLDVRKDESSKTLKSVDIMGSEIAEQCPTKVPSPCSASRFRSFDGSCNNVENPHWGKASTPFSRFAEADYADGISAPRRNSLGAALPSAKVIGLTVHKDIEKPHKFINQLLPVWAQFIDEDLSRPQFYSGQNFEPISCCGTSEPHPECFPILPESEKPLINVSSCIQYIRSLPSVISDCKLSVREQANTATHWLDGSSIYGSSDIYQSFYDDKGLFWMGARNADTHTFPTILDQMSNCHGAHFIKKACMSTPASRIIGNGYTPLTALKLIFMREHNRIAKEFQALNPSWDSARIFQQARQIVVAEIQQITFREFLPLVIGTNSIHNYNLLLHDEGFEKDYALNANPNIDAGVATAALKFWHSLLDSQVYHVYQNGSKISKATSKEFFDSSILMNKGGLDAYLAGLLVQPSQHKGHGVTSQLTDHYLRSTSNHGPDIVSEAIQRGRDHGTPGYNTIRQVCGFKGAKTFADLKDVMSLDLIESLQKIYQSVDDIDLYTGGMAENSKKDAVVGPLIACLLGRQFATLRFGDRFWYERDMPPSSFSLDQLNEVRKVTLASILCHNSDNLISVQPYAMLQSDATLNALVPCKGISTINLKKWLDIASEISSNVQTSLSNITDLINERVKRQSLRFPGQGGNVRQNRQLSPVNQFQNVNPNDNTCGERGMICDPAKKFRTIAGICNNLDNPDWGSANQLFTRFVVAAYDDGRGEMRQTSVVGGALPPVRAIRTALLTDVDRPHSKYTTLLMAFGQFIDHDMTNTPFATGPGGSFLSCANCDSQQTVNQECRPIRVPQGDPVMASTDRGGRPLCLSFTRSSSRIGPDGRRDQVNQLTAYLDGGNIYGHTACITRKLRTFSNGHLTMTRSNRGLKSLLRQSTDGNDVESQECRNRNGNPCFFTGDARSNEHPALTVMHTIWTREHNRIADRLQALNPSWNDQRLFDEARRIVIAELQHITYHEYLPRVVGQPVANLFGISLLRNGFYNDYEDTCDAGISNEFSSAAFRFGHSLVPFTFGQYNNKFQNIKRFNLFEHFSRSDLLYDDLGVDSILIGLTIEPTQSADFAFTQALTNRLFQDPNKQLGTDLVAINLQRGRDHGLKGYNSYRERCNMTRAQTFDDLLGDIPKFLVDKLAEIYRHVDDIDLYAGGNAELPVIGGLVGPTFSCIIAEQFLRLRKCDRFWYESSDPVIKFSDAQLAGIRKVTLAKVACQNSDTIDRIQRSVFDLPDTFQNDHVTCDEIPELDLTPWQEVSSCAISGQTLQVGETKRVSPCISCTCTANGPDCRSMGIKNCQELKQDFSEQEILDDDVCRVQCSKDLRK